MRAPWQTAAEEAAAFLEATVAAGDTVIAAVSGDTVTIRLPKPGDEPELRTFVYGQEPVTAYEYCNLHGYWKGEG